MLPLHLDPIATQALLALPESGMGFQHVAADYQGRHTEYLVLDASIAFELSTLDLTEGRDPSTIARNGALIVEALASSDAPILSSHRVTNFQLLSSRIGVSAVATVGVHVAPSSALVTAYSLASTRTFHRFSAYNPDRRVNPVTGDFSAGTYAAPDSEIAFVPTGFVAVGRFALPTRLPASFRYSLEAAVGTAVAFGTVAPAFGQAGGGVEAYFASAVSNVRSGFAGPLRLPDE